MSDALFEDECQVNEDDSQEDVMTPAELIAKLEEVSRRDSDAKVSASSPLSAV